MEDFGVAIRRRACHVDVVLLAAVPVVLLGVFLLPLSVRKSLWLSYTNPSLVNAYASNFVHLTVSHLLVNLLTYLLLAPTAYLCFLLADERKRFLVGYTFSLSALPFILSWMNTLSVTPMVGYGFSGINMAFFGLLPIALTSYYRSRFAAGIEPVDACILFFGGALLIIFLLVPLLLSVWIAIGLAIVGALAYGYGAVRRLSEISVSGVLRMYREDPVGYGELATVGLIVYLGIPFAMFTSTTTADGKILNFYSHFLGYSFGFIASYITFNVLEFIGAKITDTA